MLKLANETDGNFTFEYSPESFSGTEVDYAVEVCNAVLDVWKPSSGQQGDHQYSDNRRKCDAHMYLHVS